MKVVVDFLAQPDAFKGELPPEIENYDATPYLLSALPISLSVLGIQLAHEIAHKVVASTRNVSVSAAIPQTYTATSSHRFPWKRE